MSRIFTTPRRPRRAPPHAHMGVHGRVPPPARARGFTLIELMVALAVVAILATLAVPTYAEFTARQRLAAAAQQLTLELNQARQDAVGRGVPMHVTLRGGPQWCFAVSAQPACDCGAPAPCAQRHGGAGALRGVELSAAAATGSASFDPRSGRSLVSGPLARLDAGSGLAVRIDLQPSGRARACSEGARIGDIARCAGPAPAAPGGA